MTGEAASAKRTDSLSGPGRAMSGEECSLLKKKIRKLFPVSRSESPAGTRPRKTEKSLFASFSSKKEELKPRPF
ncbi:MAG TPA: hypothetical protein VMA86_07625 [Acetobacteraceae bacterium]|nr:hypothetical protein [Acetobacteraceae bacterium]